MTSRQVIENKLLTALSDSSTVAILATEEDLRIMISALRGFEPFHGKAVKMAEDYQLLLNAAFPRIPKSPTNATTQTKGHQ
jgi:hypothetical protein